MFDEPFFEAPSAKPSDERWKAVGRCNDVLIAVVYTKGRSMLNHLGAAGKQG